jgi:hypothetical protein
VFVDVPLSRYFNDTSIQGPLSAATFRGIGLARRDIDIGYRMFRIFQTRANARGSEYLNLSGMELYGLLFGTCMHRHAWRGFPLSLPHPRVSNWVVIEGSLKGDWMPSTWDVGGYDGAT